MHGLVFPDTFAVFNAPNAITVEEQGGGNYQTKLNDALRKHMEQQEQPLEDILRRVVREELKTAHLNWRP